MDGLGLDKWDYTDTAALAMHATGRRFYNFIEEAHEDVISNQKAEHGATLVAKHKSIRFFDVDIGEGKYYRIRADRLSCVGKRAGGWLATCDEMPSDSPSEDPRRARSAPASTTRRCASTARSRFESRGG